MLVDVLRANRRKLGRGAALLLITGMTAGCSSQMARFNSTDDLFTGSTDNQRQIINGAKQQAYPGDRAPIAAAEPIHTGTINRSALAPVASQPYPSQAAPTAVAPVRVAERQDPSPGSAAVRKPRFGANGGQTGAGKPGSTPFTAAQPDTQKSPLPSEAPSPAHAVLTKAPKAKDVANAATTDGASKDRKPAAVADKKPEAKVAKVAAAEPKASSTEKTGKKIGAKSGGYTVQSGDTLSGIARKTGVSVAALKSANGIKDGGLKIGQSLTVPVAGAEVAAVKSPSIVDATTTSSTPSVKQAATKTDTAQVAPPKKAEKVMEQAEASTEAAPNATGIGKMRWPVRGRVLSSYAKGGSKSNDGIDIAVPEGTAVKAAENGVVIYAGDGLKEFGNTVLVRHENGLVTVYGNASALNVKRGEKVKRGQEIAVSGMSGNADTPKLHFEVRKNSAPVDPSTFLE